MSILDKSTLPKVEYFVPYGENAFLIMGGWQRAARRAGWPGEAITQVINEAKSGDYDNLCRTIENYSD